MQIGIRQVSATEVGAGEVGHFADAREVSASKVRRICEVARQVCINGRAEDSGTRQIGAEEVGLNEDGAVETSV